MERKISLDYLAALIDGEGSIFITNTGQLLLSIVNTNKEIISLLHLNYGGYTSEPISRSNCKDLYVVRWSGKEAKALLTRVYSSLTIKRLRADLALMYPVRVVNRFSAYSEREKSLRLSIKNVLTMLNAKGTGIVWSITKDDTIAG